MSDVYYKPLIEDMTWSYSRIKCFEDCRYRWYLKYICGCQDRPMFYSSYGSFIHKLLERFYKGEITKEEMEIKFLFGFQKEVLGERPNGKIVNNYINSGIEYLKNFQPLPFNTVAVEQKIDFKINNISFTGFIDYIGEKDGEIFSPS